MPLLRLLLLHIALGMQHLHAHGIVHGELRLDNIMITGAMPGCCVIATAATTASADDPTRKRRGSTATAAAVRTGTGSCASASTATATAASNSRSNSSNSARTNSNRSSSSTLQGAAAPTRTRVLDSGVPTLQRQHSYSMQSMGSIGSNSMNDARQLLPPAGNSSSNSMAAGSALKLKDIGLCTVNFSHRQVGAEEHTGMSCRFVARGCM